MAKQYKVLVNTGKEENNKAVDVQQFSGDKGQPVRIKAQAGAKYQLQEVARGKNVGPDYVKAKRVGKNLHILFEGETEASLIIEDYYGEMAPGYNGVIGQAENGSFYEYIPEDPRVPGLIPELAEGGQAVNVALGGAEVTPVGAAVAVAAFPLLGALGLLGAAGAAAYVANKDGTTTTTTGGDLSSASDSGSSDSDNITKQNSNLVINGKGAPNSTVDVVIKDANGNTVYTGKATTDANGNYSYTVPNTLPDGKYTPYMNGSQGTSFTVDTQTVVDMTNAGRAGTTDPISGTGEAGATIKVYDASGNLVGTTTVGTDGKWSLTPSSPVPAGTLRAEATDVAGNTAADTASNNADASQKTALTIDPITGDNVISAAEGGAASYNVTGKVTGKFAAGDTVNLVLNGKTFTTTVAADGTYSLAVPMAELKADSDTKIEASVTGTGGDKASAAQDYTVESTNTVTQTALSINPVTADNIIGAAENTGSIAISGKVTGKFAAGDTVTLSVNGKTFTGAAAADGSYSISVPASDLAADSDTQIDGSVTGSGGTKATAIQDYGIDLGNNASQKTALTIDPITGDNVLLASEQGAASYTVTGKVTGSFAAGDLVSLSLNGKTYTALVAADGTYSANVAMADLKADSDTKIEASVTGTGGDKASAAQDYTVESTNTVTQTALSINPVTADNIIGAAENTGSIAISGKVTGKFAAGDTVTLTINGKTFTGAAAADGSYSISVPASDLAADSDTQIDGSVTGSGGTKATAIQDYGIDLGNNASQKTALTIDPITGDNVLLLSEQGATSYTVTGKVTGSFAAGDLVSLSLNGKTYTGLVAADGSYQIAVSMSDLKQDTDTKIEGSVTGTGGDKASAAQDYTLEAGNTATQTALSIDPVTADNLISTAENTGNIAITGKVTGKYAAGDTVTLTINGKTFTGTAAANGSYSINVPAADLAADSDTQIDASVTGTGGTLARAMQDYGVDSSVTPTPTAKTALHIEPISSNLDNILSLSEGNSANTTVGGFVSGTFAAGDQVILVLNGRNYTAIVDADGNYSVSVLTTDLKADADKTIEASITGTGGSAATAAQTYQIETAANTGKITALSIDPVTADNMLGSTETTGNIPVNGYVSGAFSVNDTVTLTINGKTFTGKPDSTGFFSINVPATDLAADSDTKVEGTVTGTGGTTAKAVQDYGVDPSYNRNIDPGPNGDTTAPTIAVERLGQGTLTSSETIRFTLSEASTNFNQGDVSVSGGTLSNFTPVPTSGTAGGGYTQYTATFTPNGNSSGTATIGVAAGKFTDNAGNQNLDTYAASADSVSGHVVESNNQVSISYNTQANPNPPADTTAPSIIVARAGSANLASGNTELITFTLSEASTTFTQADIDVSGGSLSGFAPVPGSGNATSGYHQYTAVFTPAANSVGTATIGVAAGKFTDAANNANTDTYVSGTSGYEANNLVTIGYNTQQPDATAPSIVVSRAGSGTVTGSETIYFTLTEASSNFVQADIDVTGGTLSNFAPVATSGSAGTGYTQYSATFTPTSNASGSATISVAAGKFTDAAGNANKDTYSATADTISGHVVEANNQVVLDYNTRTSPATPDTTAPTIAITADKATLTAGQTAQLSFVLSEPSSDFAQTDVAVTGGTLSNWVQVSPTQYTATFTPTSGSQGSASVHVASSTFRDAALNYNADGADANNTVNFITNYGNNNADTSAPTIIVSRMGSGTLTSSETITFTLSEASTTFNQSDIDVAGGTLSNFTPVPTSGTAGSGYTKYTATFTPATNSTGTATIGVAAGKFTDNAGNANQDDYRLSGTENANNQVSITYNTQANPNPPADTTAPTITVDRATTSSLAAGNTELITFTLSENSSNFTLADIDVAGGSLSALVPVPSSGSAASGYHQYTAIFTPAANSVGTATIGVVAGKFTDVAGNANQDDYRLSGPENLNNQVVIAYNTRIADTTAPTIEVSRAGSGTVTGSETIYFTLSEASTTFTQSDIDVTGGTLSNFTPVPSSGTVNAGYTQYTATFTPSANSTGTATIGVKSGMFSDAAGNQNLDTYVSPAPAGATQEANNQVSLNYNTSTNPTPPADTTAPTIAITTDKATLAAGQTASVTFVLSEPSSDFAANDVQVTGGTLTNWTQVNASTYTATYTPAAGAQGTGRIHVASNAFRDAASNYNADGAEANNTVDFVTNYNNNGGDTTPPTIVVSRTGSGTLTSSETLTFTLSEASTNFVASDIEVVGGTLSNFSPVPTSGTAGTGYTQYTATFTPSANSTGTATIGVAANKFTDNAGNANQDDYRLSGTENTNNLVSIAYNTQANPTPPADTTAPSIVVARAGSGNLATGGTETITFTLSENSSTFTLDDIDVVGGTLSNFAPVATSGSASTGYHQYTATFTPTANASGNATIGVAAGKFTDAKGNANTDTYITGAGYEANNLVTIGYNTNLPDTSAPTIEVTRAGSGTVGATGETIYFTLSEASSTFTLADIDVTGGTITNLVPVASSASGAGYKQYTATFTPTANATGTATIGVASGKFTDAAGNNNQDTYLSPAPSGATTEANNQVSLSYNTSTNPLTPDTTAPTIAVTIDKSTLGAGQTATVTFTLSEASTSFVQSDVDVNGGALSNWSQVSPSVYTATFTPTANTAGTATIGVKSGMFSDAAGNNNQDTYVNPAPAGATLETNNQVSLTYNAIAADTTAPTIIVARTNAGTTLASGANETITFTLSEASMDFDMSDITVTGGTLSNFTPVPTSGTPGTGYTQYTASFTPAANSSGTATIGVAAGKFSDNAGNKNLDTYSASADSVSGHVVESDNQVTLAYNTIPADTTTPVIALSRKGSGNLTAGGSDEITFTLSEASTTFTLADIDVVGGTLTNFAPVLSSGDATRGYTDYTATFTPTANSTGLARIGVQSGKFTDAANNANLDTYVSGVAGTTVEANNVIDINYNTTLPDTTAPTIIVSRAAAGMVSTNETIYFTLSEASSTFTLTDIDVQGGTLSGFAPVPSSGDATSGYTQYTAVFTPSANSTGTATVGVKSGTFTDMAGNTNADTYVNPAPAGMAFETNNQVSLNYNTLVPDTTAPTIAIDRSGTGVVTSTETITFTLSEPSTNFIANDIDVSGGSLSNFQPVLSSGSASTGYTQYTATFTPTAGVVGSAWVAVASNKFTDAASNANLDTYLANVSGTTQEANNIVSFSVNTDTTAPTVAIARANGMTTQTFTGAETITITLSEASTDFSQSDLTVSGGTFSGFAPVASSGSAAAGYTQYTVTFTPTANTSGTATISVAHNTFTDAGGNSNRDTGTNPAPVGALYQADNLISAPFNTDSTTPTVIVTRTSGASGTVTGAESITFTFSEAINASSFDASDVDAVGGTISNLQPDPSSGSAATGYTRYSATFTPTANTSGSGSVGVKNAKFSDMAGNQNADTYVNPAPTGANYQADNQVSFSINTSAPDTTAPTIAITRAGAGTVTGTETIYFTLSEASSDFTAADVDVSGGSLSNFQQSSTNPLLYSATFTPANNSTATATIGVAAGKFKDAANNQNLDTYSGAATSVAGQVVESNNLLSLPVNTDTTSPTIVVGRIGSGTVTGPITVTFTLSEASTDFTLSDIDAVGGTLSNLQGSGTYYTATFTPAANAVGQGSVGVASGKFSDAGSNLNKDTYLSGVPGTTLEDSGANTNIVIFNYSTDTTQPTIALARSGASGTTFTAAETITFTLSETSGDFTAADVAVSGGTLSNFQQSSSNPLVYTATFTPNANASGTASISVASNKFSDSAGNFNQDGADANNTITAPFNTVPADTTPPTIAISRANGNTTQNFTGAETIYFDFSEGVATTSFTSGDIDPVGGTVSNLQPDLSSGSASTGYTRYSATFTPSTAGTVSIGVDASRFADAAGNSNVDTYRSGVAGTTNEANNLVSATYVPPANNTTATIDILGMTTDAGTSATDFKTNDRSLTFNGSINNWISTNGDRVMLEVIDADPNSGTYGLPIGSAGFTTPAADGTWSWTDSNTNRASGLYSLKATIVSATGSTALNPTNPTNVSGNLTNGGWDNQLFSIDTGANNTDINLGVSITTDTSNDGNVSTAELSGASTFTSRATFNSNAKAGDKITFTATNDGTALTPVTVTLSATDISNGWVETTFAIPADSKTQVVKVNYTDNAGNVATDTQPQDSATLVLANNTTATIDITTIVDAATSSADTGASNSDFVTSDQTLTYKGTIDGWVAGLGDRVMLQFLDSSGNQIGSNAFVTPNADGSWTWNDTSTTRAAGTYSLKATIVSATGTTALNSTAPVSGTDGGYDQQVVVIDTGATNADINLAMSITTDADNNTWVNASELGSSTTFTSRATFANGLGSSVKAGDKITFNASNDGVALTPVTVTLTQADIGNGYVQTTFTKPADGKQQVVTASYTDLAGNAAAGTVSDSATLDVTSPTIALARTDSNGTAVGGVNTLKTGETATITLTLSEAPASGTLTAADLVSSAGGTIGTVTATADPKVFTITYTPPANAQGTDIITVADHVFTDAAGNYNLDTYVTGAASPLVYEPNNQVSIAFDTQAPTQTVTLSSMTKDTGLSGATANSNWNTSDGSAGRLLSGFISAPLAAGEVVKVYANGSYLGDATVAANGTTWEFTDTSGYSANWTYSAKVVDAVGNAGTANNSGAGQLVTLNTSAEPAPAITAVKDVNASNALVANGGSSSNSVFTISGTGHAAGDTVYVYDNTRTQFLGTATVQSDLSWSLPSVTMPGGGTQNFYAYQLDTLGNVSNWSNTYTITTAASSVITNGDFANGTTGLVTDFTVYPSSQSSNAGSWALGVSSTSTWNWFSSQTATLTDQPTTTWANGTSYSNSYAAVQNVTNISNMGGVWNTLRSGTYLVGSFDSATTDKAVWSQSVNVVAGQTYKFSFDYGVTTIRSAVDGGGLRAWVGADKAWEFVPSYTNQGSIGTAYITYVANTTGPVNLKITLNNGLVGNGADFVMDDVSFTSVTTPPSGGGLSGNISGATSGADSNLTFGATDGGAVGLDGDDIITVSNTNLQAQLTAGGFIHGGAGIDTLKLAAGTKLSLASLTSNQTVKPIQEIEVFTMQGSSSVLSMTANDVLSMGGAVSTMGPTYTFGSTTQGGGATGSTSSTGKVQVVVHGQTGDTLNLQALANDAVTGTGNNAGIFGNTGLAGSWAYKGTVVLNDAQGTQHTYKVYDHSTTGAQVLADVNVTVNTLSPITIESITTDAGPSSTDFVTNDATLLYTGTVPVLAAGEKVHVKIVNPSTLAVMYEGDAVLNGTNWTLDKTAATLADGSYVIQAQIVDSSGNAVSSYGALGSATHALTVDTGTPTIAVTQSGTGNTRTVTFTLSEASTTFDASDVDVTNGTLTNFAPDTSTLGSNGGYTRYTATFTAPSNFSGTATVGVLNSKFTDMAGNANLDTYAASPTSPVVNDGNNQVSFAVDGVPPTVAISSNQLYLNSTTNTATITFTFSEAVVQGSATNQFDLSDVVYSGGTLTGLTPVAGTGNATNGYTQYTATFTATANSTTDGFIGIQDGKFADAAGNLNIDTYVAGVANTVQESDNALNLPINTTNGYEFNSINGSYQHALAGIELQPLGDVNGDGFDDFAIADRSDFHHSDVGTIPPKTYVVYGSGSAANINLTAIEAGVGGFVINGSTAYRASSWDANTMPSKAGDINGDGLQDVIITEYNDTKSYVIYGTTGTGRSAITMSALAASDGFSITGQNISDPSSVGDINGDGYDDLYVVNLASTTGVNQAAVIYGSANPTSVVVTAMAASQGFKINSAAGQDLSHGYRDQVVSGDFNGDGYNDFVVTTELGNSTGGVSYVLFGGSTAINAFVASGGNLSNLSGAQTTPMGYAVTGALRNDIGMGKTGTSTGDVNGDGLADFVISDTNYATTKAVYVAFGKTTTSTLTLANISSGSGGFAINTNGLFGDADIVGDFNGDGLADVLFAGNNNTSTDPGKAWLIYGKTDGAVVNLSSITDGTGNAYGFVIKTGVIDTGNTTSYYNMSMMGESVSAAGDLNGDGFADLLVSLPNADVGTAIDAGQTYVIYGGQFSSGSTAVFTAANGDRIGTSAADTLVGTSGNNQMVAGAGDDTLTGNGGADVLYGGAGNDTFVLNASNVAAFANASNTTQAVMKVDGGTGIDTLKLDGSGITLDLTAITKADLGNVEIFDISGSGANTLKLNMRDVLELGQRNTFNVDASAVDSKVQLMITGDNGDFVQLTDIANWSQPLTNSTYSFGGHTYNVYNNAGAQLLIDQLIVQAGHLSA